jgi:16S rRNA (cytosine967-C5)-methyltransferase
LSDPRREAYRILRRVEEGGAYASILLEERARSIADARDVGLLTELVLGVLRRRAVLDHAISGVLSSRTIDTIDAPVLAALRIGAYSLLFLDRVPDFAAVDTAVGLARAGGAKGAAGFVNGVLRAIARRGRDLLPAAPTVGDVRGLALFHSHPLWWTEKLVGHAGWERASAILAANNEPAPTVLAPAAPDVAARLAAEGVVTQPGAFVPEALSVVSGVPQATRAFREGAFWMQDEASQLVPRLFADPIGPRVADLCAAPGGKTMALATRLPPNGFVLAADRNVKRLGRVLRNLARVQLRNVQPVAIDLLAESLALSGPFDDVLLDAPCSGTGTLRRHPEIRWRLRPTDVEQLAGRQEQMIERAATLVRPGGRLVYSVCSIEPEEGEQLVARFLSGHPDFRRGETLDTAGRPGIDGFFAALLLRYSPANGGTP